MRSAFSKNGRYCDDMTFGGDFGEKEVIGPAENSKIQKKCVPGQVRIFLYGREKLPILSLRAEAEKPRRAVRPGFILSRSLGSTHLR